MKRIIFITLSMTTIYRRIAVLSAVFFVFGWAIPAFATVTVTTATGGSTISADTTGGTFTSLTGPIISEGATADIGIGTIILNAPTGFVFDTGGTAPTVLVTRTAGNGSNNRNINDLASGSTIAVTRTSSALTVTVTAATSNSVRNSLTWQNVRVRPSAGTPIASGNIVKTGTSSVSGVTNSTTNFGTLTEVAGTATKLAFTTQPGSATYGSNLSTQPIVKSQDQFDNLSTSGLGTSKIVTLTLTSGTGSLQGTNTADIGTSAGNGTVTFSGLSVSAAGAGKILTASVSGLTSGVSDSFTISQASQTITFGTLSDKSLGDADFLVSATASSGLTIAFSSLTTGVCTVSTATVHLVSAGTCTIRASQAGDTNYAAAADVDQSFSVSAGPATTLSLTNPGDMYARSRLGYTVTRQDSSGNPTGMGTTTVYLYTSSLSATAKFYSDSLAGSVISSIDITPGNSTANFWYYDETPDTYTITASDATPVADGATGITDTTDSVVVIPVATKFVILPPTSGSVDAPITVTVQAQKPDNSVDTNYQSDVTLNTTGSATGGGIVDIINGVGTKSISDTVAETVSLSLTDSQSTGLDSSSTQSVVFTGGAIAQFTLSHPTTLVVGERAAYAVTREDQYGNASTLATSTVYLYSSSTSGNKKFYDAASGGSVITSAQIPSGQSSVQVWYYDELPGTWSITASDNSPSPDYNVGINDAVDTLSVTTGPVTTLLLSHPGTMTAGTRAEYSVTRKDQFNNLVTSGATTVYLSTDSAGAGSTTPAFYTVASGGTEVTSISISSGQSSASFWYYDPNSGTWTVTASDSTPPDGATGITDATDSIAVSAAPIVATRFVIVQPTSGTVDASIPVTVQAQDASGNVDTTYQSDVTLVASGSATLPSAGLVDIQNGIGIIQLSDTLAQTVNLSLSDSQGTLLDTSSTRSVTFAPGAVAQLALTNPGDVAAGARIGYTVSRKDQYGNTVTSGATTVNLSISSTGVNSKFYDAATGGSAITSIVISNGLSSVGFWAYDEKAGDWFITVGATSVADVSDPITVLPAAVAKFTLDDPGNMTAGTRLGYTVTRKDQFDNLVISGVNLAYFYSSSSATTTAFYTTAAGIGTTQFATINDGSSTGAVWYYDATPGTWTVTVSDAASAPNGSTGVADASDSVVVSAIPIVATRFVVLPVSAVQVGSPATVTIEAQDDTGNVDTTIQSSVTLLTTGSATGAGLVTMVNGVGTKTLSDTVAETVTLSLSDTQATGLGVSSTQDLAFSAVPVAPTGGGAAASAVSAPTITGVQLSGRAFPGARIEILSVSSQGTQVQGQTIASASGSFTALLSGIEPGGGVYGLVGIDALGRTTQTKVFNANYADRNAFLALGSVLLSPTLGLVHSTVRKGDVVGFVGMATPGYTVGAQVDGKPVASTQVAVDGSYKILFPTGALSTGSHTARVRQLSPSGVYSEYAPQKVFTVTTLFTPQTDFNQDGAINVQDWSIFLSRWSSTTSSVRLLDDLNGDGKVDVSDLSIFVRTLKK